MNIHVAIGVGIESLLFLLIIVAYKLFLHKKRTKVFSRKKACTYFYVTAVLFFCGALFAYCHFINSQLITGVSDPTKESWALLLVLFAGIPYPVLMILFADAVDDTHWKYY